MYSHKSKVLFKKELNENNVLSQVIKEVEIQNRLKHKYILRLLCVVQDVKRIYLFTDIAENGNVYQSLQRLKRFPEVLTGKYLRQLLNALTYLHHRNIVHRDIKVVRCVPYVFNAIAFDCMFLSSLKIYCLEREAT